MRIGIDIDDTICKTKEMVEIKLHEYVMKNKLDFDSVFINDIEMEKFYHTKLEEIYKNVEPKKNVVDVLRRLKNKGNELYIITARGVKFRSDIDYYKITMDWLNKNNIEVDGVVTSCYGENKVRACKREKIDIKIESDPYNYKALTNSGILCLLFDDKDVVSLGNKDFNNWLSIEKYIEEHRKDNN